MKAKELNIGDILRFAGYNIRITDIEDDVIHFTNSDKPKRTIIFDILCEGLFSYKIGWSFFVFFDVDEELTSEEDFEDFEDEDFEDENF